MAALISLIYSLMPSCALPTTLVVCLVAKSWPNLFCSLTVIVSTVLILDALVSYSKTSDSMNGRDSADTHLAKAVECGRNEEEEEEEEEEAAAAAGELAETLVVFHDHSCPFGALQVVDAGDPVHAEKGQELVVGCCRSKQEAAEVVAVAVAADHEEEEDENEQDDFYFSIPLNESSDDFESPLPEIKSSIKVGSPFSWAEYDSLLNRLGSSSSNSSDDDNIVDDEHLGRLKKQVLPITPEKEEEEEEEEEEESVAAKSAVAESKFSSSSLAEEDNLIELDLSAETVQVTQAESEKPWKPKKLQQHPKQVIVTRHEDLFADLSSLWSPRRSDVTSL